MTSDSSPDVDAAPEPVLRTRERFIMYMVISFFATHGYTIIGTEVLHFPEEVAFWITLVVVSVQNFFILMYYVYKSSHDRQLQQFVKYVQSVVGFRSWEYVLFLILHTLLGVYYLVAILIVQGQSIFLKATVYKKHVFRTGNNATVPVTSEKTADDDEAAQPSRLKK